MLARHDELGLDQRWHALLRCTPWVAATWMQFAESVTDGGVWLGSLW